MASRAKQWISLNKLGIVLILVLGDACAGQAKICSSEDAEAADAAVDKLDSWAKVAWTFKKFGHCDDGSIAEGNSEAVARLLIDRWNTLPELARLVKRDAALKQFVLRHIDTTLDTADLDKIKGLALSRCPGDCLSVCKDLLKVIEAGER